MTERPASAKLLRGVAACCGLLGVAEEMPELFKKLCPFSRARDEYVPLVGVVTLPAQIAECTQSIQGARHDRLRNVQRTCQTADGMRPRFKIYDEQQRHLSIGEIRLA